MADESKSEVATPDSSQTGTGRTEANPKTGVIRKYRRHDGDTGSSEVQVAVLTDRIRHLTAHLQKFPKDHATRRGLLQMVGRRAGLLRYMARTKPDAYRHLIESLGIRR